VNLTGFISDRVSDNVKFSNERSLTDKPKSVFRLYFRRSEWDREAVERL